MTKISVIIPTYNSATILKEALDSALAQTYPVHEIIVVDDGSSDNTREIVEEHVNIKYLRQENKGPAAARNNGIRASSGEFIAFLDADDVWLPKKLEKQMPLFESADYGMVYCDISHVVNDKLIYRSYLKEKGYKFYGSGNVYRGLLKENFIFTPTVILKRGVIDKAGCFDEDYRTHEDYKMWLNIAKEYQIGFVDEPLVIRRRHERNITIDQLMYIASGVQLFKELESGTRHDPDIKKIIREELSRRFFNLGYFYWDGGDLPLARENFINALRYNKDDLAPVKYLSLSYLPGPIRNSMRSLKNAASKRNHTGV